MSRSALFGAVLAVSQAYLCITVGWGGVASAAPRDFRELSAEQIKREVIKAVRSAPQLKGREIAELKTPFLSPQRVQSNAKLTARVVGDIRGGRVPVEIKIVQQTRILRSMRVFARVDFFAEGWALRRDQTAGSILAENDLVSVRLPSKRFGRDAVRSRALVEGAKLRRNVSARTPLREAWLSIPPLVKRGAVIELVFSRGGISLTAQGEALTDGKRGAMIRIKNLKSKKIVMGRVIGINRVDVGR